MAVALVSAFRASSVLLSILIWLLVATSCSHAAQSDIDCLKSIKISLHDPLRYLLSWNFSDNTEGFICNFNGIECWHADENKVLNIRLSDMGLRGEFPLGVSNCSSLTGLDLSRNNISGNIPKDISKLIPFVTSLDLSGNQLTGEIPTDLANCSYLNVLRLDNNQLTGRIPPQLGLLNRLKTFSVTKNRLTGPVPTFIHASFPASSYSDNAGLCGGPLAPCPKKTHIPPPGCKPTPET